MEEIKDIIELNYYNRLLNCKEQKELFMLIKSKIGKSKNSLKDLIEFLGFDIVYEDNNKNIIIANELKEWE